MIVQHPPHSIVKKINSKTQSQIKLRRFIVSIKQLKTEREEIIKGDIIVYDDVENKIVYRTVSRHIDQTLKYVFGKYPKTESVVIPWTTLERFLDIPEMENVFEVQYKEGGKINTNKIVPAVVYKETNLFLEIKIKAKTLCDSFNVRDTEGKKIEPTFRKEGEDLLYIFIGEETVGGVNTIKCEIKNGIQKFTHYYNSKVVTKGTTLEKIFSHKD